MRRTSDWVTIYNKNVNVKNFDINKIKSKANNDGFYKNKKAQSTDLKTKRAVINQSRASKQKHSASNYNYCSSSISNYSNIDTRIKKHKADNVK